jgi:uncharacterized protein (TIGR00725 family)
MATTRTRNPDGKRLRLVIGVVGSASGRISSAARQKARQLGEEIARGGYILLTGACPGLPYDAAKGTRGRGGLSIGISPALNLHEHKTRYRSPSDQYDILVYTGSGLMGREITAVRSCDIVIVIGGRSGTLGEFAIAYDEGRTVGVLTGTGGVADHIDDLLDIIHKDTGAVVVSDDDPTRLLRRAVRVHRARGAIRQRLPINP